MKRTHGLDERGMEPVKLLMADCRTTEDIQAKLKRLFAGTIEQMLEAEMDEHPGALPRTPGFIRRKIPVKYEKQRIVPMLFTVYLAAASGRSPALPCFDAFYYWYVFRDYSRLHSSFFRPKPDKGTYPPNHPTS